MNALNLPLANSFLSSNISLLKKPLIVIAEMTSASLTPSAEISPSILRISSSICIISTLLASLSCSKLRSLDVNTSNLSMANCFLVSDLFILKKRLIFDK